MASETPHPIIALWVHPRSMSTAIERIMRERGDLDCLHEPFMYYYYVGLGKRELPRNWLCQSWSAWLAFMAPPG